MSYTKQNFVNGTELQAQSLNNMDNQIASNDTRITTLENNPVPESTVKTAVDAYVEEHSAGFATESDIESLSEDIAELEDKLSPVLETTKAQILVDGTGYIKTGDKSIGDVIDLNSPTITGSKNYVIVSCVSGEQFEITLSGGTNYRTYAFVDSDSKLISLDDANTTRTEYVLTTPTNATSVIFCGDNSKTMEVYRLMTFEDRINNVYDKMDIVDTDFSDALEISALSKVLGYNKAGKYLNIAYFTDTHSNEYDSKKAIALMNKLCKSGICDMAIHGGDLLTTYNLSYNEYVTEVLKLINRYKECDNLYFVKGNHDNNHATTGSDQNASKAQYHMLFQNKMNNLVVNNSDSAGNYYYVDFPNEEMRVIVLDSFYAFGNSDTINFGDKQTTWLSSVALNTNYRCLVISHAYSSGCEITPILASATNVVGLIYGHTHTDAYSNSDGFNAINVTRAYEVNSDKYAVSIFTINTYTKNMYETRIGRGSDRTFAFN